MLTPTGSLSPATLETLRKSRVYQLGRMDGVAEMIEENARLKKQVTTLEAKLDRVSGVIGALTGIGQPRWYQQAWIEAREWFVRNQIGVLAWAITAVLWIIMTVLWVKFGDRL